METLNKLLSFIPDKQLEAFAIDTLVNKSTKKLHGQLLFKLLLYCMVTEKDNSLRGLQSALESAVFRTVSRIPGEFTISHSSISEPRLAQVFRLGGHLCLLNLPDCIGN